MVYQEEAFVGKDGKVYMLRSPEAADAKRMIAYLKATAEETEYGLSYPEEMDFSLQDEEAYIADFASDQGGLMISAFDGDALVGGATLSGVFDKKKVKHRATFGMALLKSAWGQGVGSKLLLELRAFARKAGYEQLECEVASQNVPAVGLYKKLGFQVYGERPHSLKLKSGAYLDELLMILELS